MEFSTARGMWHPGDGMDLSVTRGRGEEGDVGSGMDGMEVEGDGTSRIEARAAMEVERNHQNRVRHSRVW